jgi:hypothetical protein
MPPPTFTTLRACTRTLFPRPSAALFCPHRLLHHTCTPRPFPHACLFCSLLPICDSLRRLLFGSTDDEVAGKPIKLYLGRMQLHCIAVPEGVKASKSALQNVLNLFGTDRHFSNFNEVAFMQFTVDGEKVTLTRDKHVTFGLPHA